MMFSTKAEYGVRIMADLASHDGNGPVSLSAIAEAEGLPLAYLEHLVQRLRRAELVESRRGAHGGYTLARSAETITMAEVVEALEGDIAPIECITSDADGQSSAAARRARPRLSHQDPLDPRAGLDRAHAPGDHPERTCRTSEEESDRMSLEIQNLHVRTEDKEILKGVNLRSRRARPTR